MLRLRPASKRTHLDKAPLESYEPIRTTARGSHEDDSFFPVDSRERALIAIGTGLIVIPGVLISWRASLVSAAILAGIVIAFRIVAAVVSSTRHSDD